MYEKCISCDIIGVTCVPNLMRLQFSDLIQWIIKRQKHLGWTNKTLADKSKVPEGTINRIRSGDFLDCKYSTIRNIIIALVGGTTDEFPCNKQVEKELQQVEQLEQQAAKLATIEAENADMRSQLRTKDEQHRADIRAVREEYLGQIAFLKEQLKVWQSR